MYGLFREDCYATYFKSAKTDELSDEFKKDCAVFTLIKFLSMCSLYMTLTLKLPQIFKIVKSQSVFGISVISYYMENLSSMNTAA